MLRRVHALARPLVGRADRRRGAHWNGRCLAIEQTASQIIDMLSARAAGLL
jgi:hypothetical protein